MAENENVEIENEVTEPAVEEPAVNDSEPAEKDVKTLLIDTLTDQFHLPVILQGSMAANDVYPDAFFTFWNNYSTDEAFYDNYETEVIWNFDLNYYSNDPVSVNTVLLQAKQVLKAVGFIPDGSGHDVLSDEPTHTGRGLTLFFIEKVRNS